jgi:hypothetical protein
VNARRSSRPGAVALGVLSLFLFTAAAQFVNIWIGWITLAELAALVFIGGTATIARSFRSQR